jgi:hypothetical protein
MAGCAACGGQRVTMGRFIGFSPWQNFFSGMIKVYEKFVLN